MTCIVGIETPEGVLLGADSFIGSNTFADLRADSKLFRRNGWLAGIAGAGRIATVLQHLLEWPKAPTRPNDRAVAELAQHISRTLLADETSVIHENGGKTFSMEMLLTAGGRLYSIGSTAGVVRCRSGYLAAGSGEDYALGSLASTVGQDPKVRALTALRAAAKHSPTVRGPFRLAWARRGE